jgi:DNA invertase Pin-like site-specific DNA recombinase
MTKAPKRRSGKATDRPMVAIGYIRVSTDGQAASGAGLAAQRATIVAECERRGLPLADIVEDAGVSAKSLDRPGLAGAVERLEAGEAAVLVVAKLDRLARSVADFANLVRLAERQGWALLACDLGVDMTSPTGGLLANVTASVAEWERKIIGTRTREALAARKAAGVRLGRPRQLDRTIARRIQAERAEGSTLQAIADRLNSEGTTTPSGRLWSPALVRKIALQAPETARMHDEDEPAGYLMHQESSVYYT